MYLCDFAFSGWRYWTVYSWTLPSLEVLVESVSGHVCGHLVSSHDTNACLEQLHVHVYQVLSVFSYTCGAFTCGILYSLQVNFLLYFTAWGAISLMSIDWATISYRSAWVYRHSIEFDQLLACSCLWMYLYYNTKLDTSWFVGVDGGFCYHHWHSCGKVLTARAWYWSIKLYCIPNLCKGMRLTLQEISVTEHKWQFDC